MTSIAHTDKELDHAVVSAADAMFAARSFDLSSLGASGFAGLGVQESDGGSGGMLLHAGLVAEAAGRQRAALGYLQQLLSVHAAAARHDVDLAADLVAGTLRGAVCFKGADGQLFPTPVPLNSAGVDTVLHVVDADGAVRHLVGVHFDEDTSTWLDPTHVDLLPRGPLPRPTGSPWPTALALTNGLVASAIVGLVEGLLAETVGYVKERRQFSAPVGSFQAVKHSLAEVHIDLLHTRALAFGALRSMDRGDDRAERLVALAKISADATALTTQRCLQAMGGIGFTWESRVHHYMKPALRLRQWPQPHATLRASVRPNGNARPPSTSD